MASSNRHWPSMFKSKPCNSHHQWQHDINSNLSSSTACHRSAPYTTVPGSEERSPEPKPRWNPKPEQIRILEAIFNSGMVNPPRDEIRKIRAQLQEYGQVGDANVFYWFQNRKSRSKNKLRHNQNSKTQNQTNNSPPITALSPTVTATATATCSSSSSSDKSSPKSAPPSKTFSSNMGFSNLSDVSISNSPTANSVTQNYFQPNHELLPEPFFFPVSHTGAGISNFSQGFSFSELSSVVQPVPDQHHGVGPCTSLLLSEIMSPETSKKSADSDQDKIMVKIQPQYMSYPSLNPLVGHTFSQTTATTTVTMPSPTNNAIQGLGEVCGVGQSCIGKSTVFINGVGFEVASGPFNVREAFGDEAVLIHSNGQPVLTNEWGLTLHSLQHGAYYYLI